MLSVNKVILIGNLGRDPEIRYIEGNIKVAKLAVATNERYTLKNGNRIDSTEWHVVNLWRGLADIAERGLKKGSKVYIEGKLRTREYTDKEGNKRKTTEIEAESILLLDRKPEDYSNGGENHEHKTLDEFHSNETPYQPGYKEDENKEPDEDLPF